MACARYSWTGSSLTRALCYGPLAGFNRVVEASAKHVSARLLGSRAGIWAARHAGPFGPYAPMVQVLVRGGAAAIHRALGAGRPDEVLGRMDAIRPSVVVALAGQVLCGPWRVMPRAVALELAAGGPQRLQELVDLGVDSCSSLRSGASVERRRVPSG